MRRCYLLANLGRDDLAERVAEAVKRHLDGRDDVRAPARVFCRRGRVNVEGVPEWLALELQLWCAERVKRPAGRGRVP